MQRVGKVYQHERRRKHASRHRCHARAAGPRHSDVHKCRTYVDPTMCHLVRHTGCVGRPRRIHLVIQRVVVGLHVRSRLAIGPEFRRCQRRTRIRRYGDQQREQHALQNSDTALHKTEWLFEKEPLRKLEVVRQEWCIHDFSVSSLRRATDGFPARPCAQKWASGSASCSAIRGHTRIRSISTAFSRRGWMEFPARPGCSRRVRSSPTSSMRDPLAATFIIVTPCR